MRQLHQIVLFLYIDYYVLYQITAQAEQKYFVPTSGYVERALP